MDRSQQFIAIYIQNEKETYIYSARQALQDGDCEFSYFVNEPDMNKWNLEVNPALFESLDRLLKRKYQVIQCKKDQRSSAVLKEKTTSAVWCEKLGTLWELNDSFIKILMVWS